MQVKNLTPKLGPSFCKSGLPFCRPWCQTLLWILGTPIQREHLYAVKSQSEGKTRMFGTLRSSDSTVSSSRWKLGTQRAAARATSIQGPPTPSSSGRVSRELKSRTELQCRTQSTNI